MGAVNDKYIQKIEHSVLLNNNPLEDCKVNGNTLTITPNSYARPSISTEDKQLILKELAEDLSHYQLSIIEVDSNTIKVVAGSFELDVPKKLVIPYDDAIFATILKYHQQSFNSGSL